MLKLLKCEFAKFKGTYINLLSFLGMLSPVILVTIMFLLKRGDYIKAGIYNWEGFNQDLTIFFIFLVGPIITSFIAVFSIFYEYQEKTLKNMLASPFGRTRLILSKIIYVSAYVVLQYAVVAALDILLGFALGFDMKMNIIFQITRSLIVAGLATIILVPLMMFVTLLFKSFIPAMVLAVAGTISNVLVLNWEKSYLSPWSLPADLSLKLSQKMNMSYSYILTSMSVYIFLFMAFTVIYFNRADQSI